MFLLTEYEVHKRNYCFAYKQYVFRTWILVQWLAELVTWPVQSGVVLTDLPVRKSVLLALIISAELEIDTIVHL